jgi:2'-hydroxyisoflavone reductase
MADRNDAESVREALAAAASTWCYDNVYDWERGTTAAQVEATVRACGDRLSRYIFMSSVAAYGDGLNHKESDPLAPDNHAIPYVRNKAMTERLLFRMHRAARAAGGDFPAAVRLRTQQPVLPRAVLLGPLRAGRPIIIPGDGHRLMQFVYVGDLVAPMLRAMEGTARRRRGVQHRRLPPLTQVEVVERLAKAANTEATWRACRAT